MGPGKSLKSHWNWCLRRCGKPEWTNWSLCLCGHSGLAPITTLPAEPWVYFNTRQPVFGWCYGWTRQSSHLLHFKSCHFLAALTETHDPWTLWLHDGELRTITPPTCFCHLDRQTVVCWLTGEISQLNSAQQNYNISNSRTKFTHFHSSQFTLEKYILANKWCFFNY